MSKLKIEYKRPEPIENDGEFCDSYGNRVHHGSEIIIEHNYNYPHWNGQKAYVNWNAKQGVYQFQVEGSISTIENFYGIHKFRVLDTESTYNHRIIKGCHVAFDSKPSDELEAAVTKMIDVAKENIENDTEGIILSCKHEWVEREYPSQPYGTCVFCGRTFFS